MKWINNYIKLSPCDSCGHSYHTQCGGESPSCVLCTAAGTTEKNKAEEDVQSPDVKSQPAVSHLGGFMLL